MSKRLKILTALAICAVILAASFLAGRFAGASRLILYQTTVYGEIREINLHNGIYGIVFDGFDLNGVNGDGLLSFGTRDDFDITYRGAPLDAADLRPGDIIGVNFSGSVQETLPAGLINVTRVTVLERGGTGREPSEMEGP